MDAKKCPERMMLYVLLKERSENILFLRSGSDLGTKDGGQKYEEEVRPC
jgi:hypothetical protein